MNGFEIQCFQGGYSETELVSAVDEERFFSPLTAGKKSASGVVVNGQTALGNCNLWKGINTLAGDVGQLPVKLFKRDGRSRTEEKGIPEIDVLQHSPNAWQTPSIWKETMMWWAMLWGNGVSWIRRDQAGRVRDLVPLRPDRLSFYVDDETTGEFFYVYTTSKQATLPFSSEEVIHIKGLCGDGIFGISLLDIAKNCIGHGIALERYSASLFGNGAMPGVVLKHPGKLSLEARRNLREDWERLHKGPNNAGRTAVLAEAMEAQVLSMTNRDAEFAELRKMDQVAVANLLGLPLFKLNSMEDSSVRANLEEQNRDYFNTSLSRWLNRFAEEAARKLLSEQQRKDGYYYKWVPEAFLKGDIEKRYNSYSVAIASRVLSPNEAREKEDLDPYDGGDEYLNPAIEPAMDTSEPSEDENQDGQRAADRMMENYRKKAALNDITTVKRAADEASNFVAWIDAHYSDGGGFDKGYDAVLDSASQLIITMGYNPGDCGLWRREWRTESKRRLLKLCDQTTADRLTESVRQELDTWKGRIQ